MSLDAGYLTILPRDADPVVMGPVLCAGVTAYKVRAWVFPSFSLADGACTALRRLGKRAGWLGGVDSNEPLPTEKKKG